MSDTLVILGARGGGGSGKGISYYQKLLGCIRRATLSAEDDDYEDSEDSAIGKVGHALLEHYHLDSGAHALPFQTHNGDPALAEGLRLFAAYRERFAPASLGTVLGCEVPLSSTVGGHEATARLDMVVEMSQDDIKRVADERKVDLSDLGPGVYIVDHKFKKQHHQDMVLQFQTGPQSIHYQLMWNEAHPEKPCKGMLFNVIFRYKTVSDKMFKLVVAPPPTPMDVEFRDGIIRDGARELRERGPLWANPLHCHEFHRTCPHFFYCDRTNKDDSNRG